MAVESFYFSHDYSARADRKMVALQMSLGMEGVGIFWCIVEMLYEEGGYIMHSECERIAFELRTDKERIARVINDFELFRSDGEKFWSESALERLGHRYEKSEKARKSAEKRWNNANALRTHSDGNAIKERKGKERKENVFGTDASQWFIVKPKYITDTPVRVNKDGLNDYLDKFQFGFRFKKTYLEERLWKEWNQKAFRDGDYFNSVAVNLNNEKEWTR